MWPNEKKISDSHRERALLSFHPSQFILQPLSTADGVRSIAWLGLWWFLLKRYPPLFFGFFDDEPSRRPARISLECRIDFSSPSEDFNTDDLRPGHQSRNPRTDNRKYGFAVG